ncbi:MAG TPA: ATP-dependent sacrificial sulfur transferase LarE [Candidatus Nitrosotenuis sp.]|nr:ATP-dependent sacrificial sulfur transferase LarE [Candidatus Nitrosotenuis sp.]
MTKLEQLQNWFSDKQRVMVALSGGVDSALVAYVAFNALGKNAIAVTADYKTLAQEELESAKKICQEIGIRHIIIEYDELQNDDFTKNDNKRCFHCRSELSANLTDLAKKESVRVIVDGTNLDDVGEYRPGIAALRENGIRSPILEVGLRKSDVRIMAKQVGLSVYDRPSNSCLASRIPWGQRVTAERLARIEVGETFVKQILGARQVRVRDIEGNAKIEIGKDELLLLSDTKKLDDLFAKLKSIGFESAAVDKDGYSPGKINVIAD